MLPMGRKRFLLVSFMTVCTVSLRLSLAFGHASRPMEENAIVTHPNILGAITQRAEDAGDPETAVSLVVAVSMIIAWLACRERHGAITTLKSNIQRVMASVEDIRSQVAGIANSARPLSASVEDSSSSISELGSMGIELDRRVSILPGKTRESSASTEQMIPSIRRVAEKTDGLAGKAQDARAGGIPARADPRFQVRVTPAHEPA